MDDREPQFLGIGAGERLRRIAYRLDERGQGAGLLWLSGFLSDMGSTKATALAEFAAASGTTMLRFDYSGHGLSEGRLLDATIGDWLDEARGVFELLGSRRVVVIGSSMGGWIALLLARALAEQGELKKLAGLVLLAPAWDMTERLMWHQMDAATRAAIERDGVYYEPSLYGDPYPITRRLIEEGRSHLIGKGLLPLDLPVRILQGMCDPDVPWGHALDLVDLLSAGEVELTLIKNGDHRQSRPQDLRRLEATVAALLDQAST